MPLVVLIVFLIKWLNGPYSMQFLSRKCWQHTHLVIDSQWSLVWKLENHEWVQLWHARRTFGWTWEQSNWVVTARQAATFPYLMLTLALCLEQQSRWIAKGLATEMVQPHSHAKFDSLSSCQAEETPSRELNWSLSDQQSCRTAQNPGLF